MEIISLKCNSCSSDLQVNEKTKFFNCSFCGSSLALKKSGNAIFTEVLDEIKENTDAILDTSDKLLLEKQIARLDRDWEKEIEGNYQDLKQKNKSQSPYLLTIMGGLSLIIFLIFYNSIEGPSHHMPKPPIFEIMPVIMGIGFVVLIIVGLVQGSNYSRRRAEFKAKEKTYEIDRQKLLKKISDLD